MFSHRRADAITHTHTKVHTQFYHCPAGGGQSNRSVVRKITRDVIASLLLPEGGKRGITWSSWSTHHLERSRSWISHSLAWQMALVESNRNRNWTHDGMQRNTTAQQGIGVCFFSLLATEENFFVCDLSTRVDVLGMTRWKRTSGALLWGGVCLTEVTFGRERFCFRRERRYLCALRGVMVRGNDCGPANMKS